MGNSLKRFVYIHSWPNPEILYLDYMIIKDIKEAPKIEKLHEIFDINNDLFEKWETYFDPKPKRVILNIFNYQSSQYPNNYKLWEKFMKLFEQHEIPYQFISNQTFISTVMLKNINGSNHEFYDHTLLLLLDDDSIIAMDVKKELINRDKKYKVFKFNQIQYPKSDVNYILKKDIADEFKFIKYIYAMRRSATEEKLNEFCETMLTIVEKIEKKGYFNDVIPFAICPRYARYGSEKFLIPVNFNVYPNNCRNYYVINGKSNVRFMTVTENTILPLKNIQKVVPRSPLPYKVVYLNKFTDEYDIALEAPPLMDEKHHRVVLTLKITENNFISVEQKPIILSELKRLFDKLNSKKEAYNFPVIAIFDNVSVIYSYNADHYSYLDSWNSFYGTDLFLSFKTEKQTHGKEAQKIWLDNPSFVIYDLLKIMSMPSDAIEIDPAWGFNIIKNADNKALLEFDNFNGGRDNATPKFLMAMLLKEHVKVLKAETGQKCNELGFFLLDDFKNGETKNRVQNELREACNLLTNTASEPYIKAVTFLPS